MSDGNPEIPKFYGEQTLSETYRADGQVEKNIFAVGRGVTEPEELREMIADANGVSTDEVHMKEFDGEPYDGTPKSPRRSRTSVGFSASRWRASWDPHAEGSDPANN
jgi:hypothetical protein